MTQISIAPPPGFRDAQIAAYFDAAPAKDRAGLAVLRALIFDCAADLPDVGALCETLRWGQPSYVSARHRVGTPLRLGLTKGGGFAIYAHCQTQVIPAFAAAFPGMDRVDGSRGILFRDVGDIDPNRHGQLVRHALTYHLKPG
ncbi:MAG: DUF1801 domain-containing protein [Pseudooceanicola sp.]